MGLTSIAFSDFVNLIKIEAKVKGSDNLDTWIKFTVNELLLEYCLQKKYYELLVTNYPITTVAAQESYTLPTDFNFVELVRYQRTSSSSVFHKDCVKILCLN